MKHDIPISGGIETFAEIKHIRLRPGVRHYAKTKFARRARKAVRLALVDGLAEQYGAQEPYPGYDAEAEEFLARMAAYDAAEYADAWGDA